MDKKFKKGEKIFLEGDQIDHFYLLQAGKVSIYTERGGQRTEVDQPGIGNVFGEQSVFGYAKQSFNAEASSEVKVLEIPVEPIRTFYEKSPAMFKMFLKGLGDEVRRLRGVVRSHKLEVDNMPCPPRFIPRLCAILTSVAKLNGQSAKPQSNVSSFKIEEERKNNPHFKDTDILLSFNTLKILTARMFLESPQRMQSFCDLLGKLGYITTRYEKNEDTEQMELQEIRIHDLNTIEMFGEFYQHNFFRAGKSEVIVFDKTATQIVGAILGVMSSEEPDRNGAVRFAYKQLVDQVRSKFFIDLKDIHFGLLEKKGLFIKKENNGDSITISFNLYEWKATYRFWQIIQEIDRWNETGSVNIKENLNEYRPQAPEKCSGCGAELQPTAKFCSECGHKLAA